jgi:hypothetical protein
MLPPVARWFFFTVIPALAPLIFLASKLRARHVDHGVDVLFGKGELLLACSAFAAVGIGDILASGKKRRVAKYIVGGCCLLILLIAIDDFGDVGLMLRQHECYDTMFIALKSIWLCFSAMICGALCILLAGYK